MLVRRSPYGTEFQVDVVKYFNDRAEMLLAEGSESTAESRCTVVLSLAPPDPHTLGLRAEARHRLLDREGARLDCEQALALVDDPFDALEAKRVLDLLTEDDAARCTPAMSKVPGPVRNALLNQLTPKQMWEFQRAIDALQKRHEKWVEAANAIEAARMSITEYRERSRKMGRLKEPTPGHCAGRLKEPTPGHCAGRLKEPTPGHCAGRLKEPTPGHCAGRLEELQGLPLDRKHFLEDMYVKRKGACQELIAEALAQWEHRDPLEESIERERTLGQFVQEAKQAAITLAKKFSDRLRGGALGRLLLWLDSGQQTAPMDPQKWLHFFAEVSDVDDQEMVPWSYEEGIGLFESEKQKGNLLSGSFQWGSPK